MTKGDDFPVTRRGKQSTERCQGDDLVKEHRNWQAARVAPDECVAIITASNSARLGEDLYLILRYVVSTEERIAPRS